MEDVVVQNDAEKPIFPKSFGLIQAAGNVAIGLAEMATSFNFSRIKNIGELLVNPSALADAFHNIFADTTYVRHGTEMHNDIDEETLARRRRVTYIAIFAGAAAVSGAAASQLGYDILRTTEGQTLENDLSIWAVVAAGSSFAFSSLRYIMPKIAIKKRLEGGGHLTESEKDTVTHLRDYDIPSAFLALTGTLIQKYVHLPFNINTFANEALGIYGGWLGMKHFVPTTSNLEKHNHNHVHQH